MGRTGPNTPVEEKKTKKNMKKNVRYTWLSGGGEEQSHAADRRAKEWRRKGFSKSGDFPDGQNLLLSLIFI